MKSVYRALAYTAMLTHLVWVFWVALGFLFTRGRPRLAAVHIVCLVYSIINEATAMHCPLTTVEHWAQRRAGMPLYSGDFLVYYLGATLYPDVPPLLLMSVAIAVCVANLVVYARRLWRWCRFRSTPPADPAAGTQPSPAP